MVNSNNGSKKALSKKSLKGAGFTLIELLVAVFIISLLSVLILASYRSGQKKYALDQAAQKLVSDIRKAQNMAMGGVDIEGQYYGYGIYIRRQDSDISYVFYGDKTPPSGNNKYDSGTDEVLETVNLPNQIKIQSTNPASKVDVFFRPPEPITYINAPSGVNPGTITLKLEDASLTKVITVTAAGLVYSD